MLNVSDVHNDEKFDVVWQPQSPTQSPDLNPTADCCKRTTELERQLRTGPSHPPSLAGPTNVLFDRMGPEETLHKPQQKHLRLLLSWNALSDKHANSATGPTMHPCPFVSLKKIDECR